MAADRQPKMRAMIMARTEPERRAALAELLPLQQQDFEGLFAAMPGKPVTIRLLDPPLHEFLPDRVALAQRVQKARDEHAPELAALEQELELVLRLGEVNPMLGTRGCRLGIVHPEIYEMQVEAIMRAARAADGAAAAGDHDPARRLRGRAGRAARRMVARIGERHGLREGEDYIVGTMIELPRACFIADRLAADADVLLLRHQRPHPDRARLLARRRRGRVRPGLPRAADPRPLAVRVDRRRRASARWSRSRCRKAARGRAGIELGVCGEHGGDPDSIAFFHRAGLDYVSCSPYRLPIARVAAAQAALATEPRARRASATLAARQLRRRAGAGRRATRCIAPSGSGRSELAGRRIWNVNSTARGGGVAEMLGAAARLRARRRASTRAGR